MKALDRRTDYWFILPALLLIGLIVFFPLAYNLYMSTNRWLVTTMPRPRFVGLQNYGNLLLDRRFWNSLRVTGLFTLGALSAQVVLGTLMALFFQREFRGRMLVKTIFLFPISATPVAVSLIWAMMYNYDLGVINHVLRSLGITPLTWLADPRVVLPALIITDTWQWTPLIMLIVLAGLESLPDDPVESAVIDGANRFQTLVYITLPMVKPHIISAAMIRSIDTIKTFDLIYVMTQGGPGTASENLNMYTFSVGFSYYRMGAASALAVSLFMLVLVVNVLLSLLRKRTAKGLG